MDSEHHMGRAETDCRENKQDISTYVTSVTNIDDLK